jgi:hypothetical protein
MTALLVWQNVVFCVALLLGVVLVFGTALGLDDASDTDELPLSISGTLFCFAFGASGLGLSALLGPPEPAPAWALLELFLAGAAGLAVARAGKRLLTRLVPAIESYATDKADLVGTLGAAETAIGRDFGIARVTDATGSLLQLKCRAGGRPIEKGSPVLVVEYDPESDFYLVDEFSTEPRLGRTTEGRNQ